MAYYGNILEEELKNKVAHDYFCEFDTTQIVGKIDFCIAIRSSSDNTAADGGGICLILNNLREQSIFCGLKQNRETEKIYTNLSYN